MIFDTVDIDDSLGCYLAHSMLTRQGRIGKGTLITTLVVDKLIDSGFRSILVARLDASDIHEDRAAETIAQKLVGGGVSLSNARTGRVNLLASTEGLCQFDPEAVKAANLVDEGITVATLPENQWVPLGRMVATIKIIPYAVGGENLQRVLDVLDGKTLSVTAALPHTAVLIQTRLDSIKEKVLDKTRRVVKNRLVPRSVHLLSESRCSHTVEDILQTLSKVIQVKPDWVVMVGASAISDRADVIPRAIVEAGGQIDRFGIPVDPGNLLMLGRLGAIKVIGLPGCARSPRYNGLDMIVDRLACGLPVTDQWLSGLSVGGLLTEIADRPAPRVKATVQHKVGVVILAAGSSRRAGSVNKLLVPYGGVPMVSHVAQIASTSMADQVVAITGYDQASVSNALSATGVECHYNAAHASGMASSVVAGMSQMTDNDAVLICLGDMPHVTPMVLNQLIRAFRENPDKSIFLPVVDGRRGNPVLFGKVFFDNLLALSGDSGARKMVAQYPDEVFEVHVEEEGVLTDYDTVEELERLEHYQHL